MGVVVCWRIRRNADWSSAGVGSSIQNGRYCSSEAPSRAGLDWRQPVVHIVQDVHAVAELLANVRHHLRREVQVGRGFPHILLRDVVAGGS